MLAGRFLRAQSHSEDKLSDEPLPQSQERAQWLEDTQPHPLEEALGSPTLCWMLRPSDRSPHSPLRAKERLFWKPSPWKCCPLLHPSL